MLGFHVPGHDPPWEPLVNEASSFCIHDSQHTLEIILPGSSVYPLESMWYSTKTSDFGI